jgi:hypothetical protein
MWNRNKHWLNNVTYLLTFATVVVEASRSNNTWFGLYLLRNNFRTSEKNFKFQMPDFLVVTIAPYLAILWRKDYKWVTIVQVLRCFFLYFAAKRNWHRQPLWLYVEGSVCPENREVTVCPVKSVHIHRHSSLLLHNVAELWPHSRSLLCEHFDGFSLCYKHWFPSLH